MEPFEFNLFKIFLSEPVKTKLIYFFYELIKNQLFILQLNHMFIPQPPFLKQQILKNVTLRCCVLYDFCIYLKLPFNIFTLDNCRRSTLQMTKF